MVDRTRLPTAVLDSGIIAVVRSPSVDEAIGVALELAASGVRAIELTLTTPGLLDAWPTVTRTMPDHLTLGIGTITTPEQAAQAADARAAFVVTPVHLPDVLAVCVATGVPAIGGALTPTEIHATWRAGAAAVKVFPAATVGPDYFAHLRGPFPEIPLVPSGGIAIDAVGRWVRAGAVAVSLGGPLTAGVEKRRSRSLSQRAAAALAAVADARAGGSA